jgi:hypothetical protein
VRAPVVRVEATGGGCTVTIASPGRSACLECTDAVAALAARRAQRPGSASGPVAGIAGALAARAAVDLLVSEAGRDHVLVLDLEPPRFEKLALEAAADCRGCARIADLVEVGA